MSDNKFDLRGLDTFSQPQAAHYMNRSLAKFKQTVKLLGIPHFYVDGIKTFRKIDIQAAVEQERHKQWRASESVVKRGTSTIGTMANVTPLASAKSRDAKRKRHVSPKNTNSPTTAA